MSIHFSEQRFLKIKESHMKWWNGKLNRPLMRLEIKGAYEGKNNIDIPLLSQSNSLDFSIPAETIIDRIDSELSFYEFLGDSFPFVNFDAYGPSVLAGMLGAKADNSTGNIWFYLDKDTELKDIPTKYNPDNLFSNRIKSLYKAGKKKWGDSVLLGMPDLGSPLDVLAALRGNENLLMDLIDCPDEVIEVSQKIEKSWYDAYFDFSNDRQFFTDWSGILSDVPSYIIQCDFSYMISPSMFNTFVLPYLKRACEKLDNVIFHMDGVGELIHLDSILSIKKLKAIQWQFGAGKPPAKYWGEVYNKIRDKNKKIWFIGEIDDLVEAKEFFGDDPYFYDIISLKDMSKGMAFLKEFKIPIYG